MNKKIDYKNYRPLKFYKLAHSLFNIDNINLQEIILLTIIINSVNNTCTYNNKKLGSYLKLKTIRQVQNYLNHLAKLDLIKISYNIKNQRELTIGYTLWYLLTNYKEV